jgi:hypothetical protein
MIPFGQCRSCLGHISYSVDIRTKEINALQKQLSQSPTLRLGKLRLSRA